MEAGIAAVVLTSVTGGSLALAVLLGRVSLALLFHFLPRPSAPKPQVQHS
jgi:hypothetical protein